jgi:excinuclease ABC subunit A
VDVGLDYLTLERATATLSGGEAQRIRLATQIGAGLMGVLYILDEPSIGLAPARQRSRHIATLERLRDLGNTVIVVEHDEETMRRADYVIDIGPGAGEHGGEVVAAGTPKQNRTHGRLHHGRLPVRSPHRGACSAAIPKRGKLRSRRPTENNLKDVTVIHGASARSRW